MKLKLLIVCALSLGLTLLCQSYAPAADQPSRDNLHLGGSVLAIDMQNNLVTIDVTSESCHGKRQFKFSSDNGTVPFTVGQRILFVIDGNTCQTESTPEIINVENFAPGGRLHPFQSKSADEGK